MMANISHHIFNTVKESDTYILEGILRFTIDVDCSMPFLS